MERTKESEMHNHQQEVRDKQIHIEMRIPENVADGTEQNEIHNYQQQGPDKQRGMEKTAPENIPNRNRKEGNIQSPTTGTI